MSRSILQKPNLAAGRQVNVILYFLVSFLMVIKASSAVAAPSTLLIAERGKSTVDVSNREMEEVVSRRKSWSSIWIPPGKILSTLSQFGWWIPPSAQEELDLLRQVVHVDKAELNIMDREVTLYNLMVVPPPLTDHTRADPQYLDEEMDDDRVALRIQEVLIRWDSFTQPCLDVQLKEVDVLVDFWSFLPPRNNWSELKEYGWALRQIAEKTQRSMMDQEEGWDSWVRFHQVVLSGSIQVRVASRPLPRRLGQFRLDAHATQDLTRQIQHISDQHRREQHRAGCSMPEVAQLLQGYFTSKVQQAQVGALPPTVLTAADHWWRPTRHTLYGWVHELGQRSHHRIRPALIQLKRTATHIDTLKELPGRITTSIIKRLRW